MINEMLLPVLILLLLGTAACRRVAMYDLFVKGAKDGLLTAVKVLPNLAAMLCAVSLMQVSGLLDGICSLLAPLVSLLGLPIETSPLILLRPLSGSASMAMLENILERFGADSRAGLIASTVMGSSETIFYTVCVYMSGVSDRRTGYAIPCALAGALAGTCVAGILF